MTQKRRVIYMTDEEWTLLKATADERGESISRTVRRLSRNARGIIANDYGGALDPLPVGIRVLDAVEGTVEPTGEPVRPLTQSEKDAILNRVNRKKTGE